MARTGSISLSYVTLYGDVISETIIEVLPEEGGSPLEFGSSGETINGYQTNIVGDVGKISFSGTDDINIVGEKTIISPSPASIAFSSEIDTIGVVEIISPSPAVISFSSDNIVLSGYESILSPDAAKIQLSGAGIEVNGYKATISPDPAKITFSTSISAEISPFTLKQIYIIDVMPSGIEFSGESNISLSGYTTILSVGLNAMTFDGASDIGLISRDAVDFTATLPSLSSEIIGNTVSVVENLEVVLPSLNLESHAGGNTGIDFPVFEMDATGTSNRVGVLASTFPSLNLEAHSGGLAEITMPAFTAAMEAVVNRVAQASATLPSMTFLGVAARASEGDIAVFMPSLQLSMGVLSGIIGEIDSDIPKLGMSGKLKYGTVGQIEGVFGRMDLRMSAGPTGPGSISAVLPVFEMEMGSGTIESEILRYVREKNR